MISYHLNKMKYSFIKLKIVFWTSFLTHLDKPLMILIISFLIFLLKFLMRKLNDLIYLKFSTNYFY